MIGEYGVSNHFTEDDKETQMENMQYYLKCVVSEAREHGFAAFVWDNNAFNNGPENFGIFKRWQNMAVGNTYFLKGITEGAGAEYKEPDNPGEDPDAGKEGVTFWEGDAVLDWGNGLQLTIPASAFEGKGDDVQLVMYYTQEYTDYDDLQLFYGDWSSMVTFRVGEAEFTGDFIPSSYYATGTGTDHITPISFSKSVLNTILQRGVVVQGHGIRLTKVVLTSPSGVREMTAGVSSDGHVYTLDGKKVVKPLHKGVYIQNGKKRVIH